jgi:GT2 family glycosyltransferase/SAM-dependent methyltransferase
MDDARRADAPRLIEWTGERMVPWAPDVQVIYEHLQRYWFAAGFAAGRRALDVGSGEGYGTAMLASVATSAVGIELDEQTVRHSRANYDAPNLEFRHGSALDLSAFGDGEFGLVACFEVIEHVAEQERLLGEIARVLAPDGILVCSTPDRVAYSEDTGVDNPYHVRELDQGEFRGLLAARFDHTRLWGQRTTTGATIYPLDDEGGVGGTIFVERRDGGWSRSAAPAPMYMIAAASTQPLPPTVGHVALADPNLELVRAADLRVGDTYAEIEDLHRLAGEQIARLERDASTLRDLADERAAETRTLRQAVHDFACKVDDLQGHIRYLYGEVAIMNAEAERVRESLAWRMLERAREQVKRPDGERNALGRAVSFGLTRVAALPSRGASRRPADPAAPAGDDGAAELLRIPPPCFPDYEAIEVSIVIPVHDQPAATLACLHAVSVDTDGVSYEVIVVDDASGPETAAMLARVGGARILRNERNQGFLRSSNRGAAQARGRHVVFLNNDTEVQPGWLRALVDLVESADDVGAVGAKLLLPDRRVQEGGGIVWRDGGARHVGRGEHHEEAALNYVREVDYCSAACLLVRRDVLRELGGFDDRYAPAYYEDADLCFGVRARGMRVLYQPRAEVVHHEGTSHGLDVTQGVKANQVRNAAVFLDKWRETLEREQPEHDLDALDRVMDRARGPRVLVVDHRVPRVREDAGSVRMMEIVLALHGLGCRVTFLPDNRDRSEPHTTELQQAGIEVLYGHFDESHYIRCLGGDLDLAILSRPTVAWRYMHLLREFTPDAYVVYDTVDLHYLRQQRRAEAEADRTFERVSQAFRELELGIIRSCDETIAVSNEERAAILGDVPRARVAVLPTINRVVERHPPVGGRSGLMFLGGFAHSPNVDAAIRLVEDLLPRIRAELGPVGLAIVGSNPPAAVKALARVDGVEVTGFVEDLTPWFERSRMMVAPLVYGAGVNGKLTHSMASGLPIVTTAVGAEGLQGRDGADLLIAADEEAFVAAVVRLYRDDALWTRLSQAGLALAARRFGPEVARSALEQIVARATAARDRHDSPQPHERPSAIAGQRDLRRTTIPS